MLIVAYWHVTSNYLEPSVIVVPTLLEMPVRDHR